MAGDYHITGDCVYNAANFRIAVYVDMDGYTVYGDDRPIETDGVAGDPFWAMGVDTESWTYGVAQAEIGLLEKSRIKFGVEGGVESVWAWDITGPAWVNLLAGGVPHVRLHAMTSNLDHNANQWKMWYSDGTLPNAKVDEFALGVAGTIVKSAGPAAPPTFTTHTLDNAFDHGKEIDGATSSANAFRVGDGVDKILLYGVNATNEVFIEIVGGATLKLKGGNLEADGAEKVYDAVWN